MNGLRLLVWSGALALAALAPLSASAQSIYKCPLRSGGFEYTDSPCSGPGASVVHKATAGEVAAKTNEDDRQAMLSMLRVGAAEQAKEYAVTHHQEVLYNSIVASLVQEEAQAEQRKKQQVELAREQHAEAIEQKINTLSTQNAALQQQVTQQDEEIELQRENAEDARQRATAAQDAAINARNAARRARQEAETPQYNPQTGQWCQEIGGTLQCN